MKAEPAKAPKLWYDRRKRKIIPFDNYSKVKGAANMRDTSLVFPLDGQGRILLGRKKRGMGYGKWNGFGGKMEIGESMRECVRELFEECGLFAEEKDLDSSGGRPIF